MKKKLVEISTARSKRGFLIRVEEGELLAYDPNGKPFLVHKGDTFTITFPEEHQVKFS